MRNFELALDEYHICLIERMADVYWSLRCTSNVARDTQRAQLYACRSLAAYEELDCRRAVAAVYSSLGQTNVESGHVDEALTAFQKAHELAESLKNATCIAETKRGLASLYLMQGRIDEASRAVQQALESAQALSDISAKAEALLLAARIFEADNDSASANVHFSQAIALLKEGGAAIQLSDAHKQYSEFRARQGDNLGAFNAFKLLKEAWAIRESQGAIG
jgi:tetratricopeptide (TPR) repeat protein